ncbi:MAG: efflux RND transporter permease subunit [Bacteroidota bacterium]|jgi:multidrug efflux pump subunit AcrB|nr:efflux RND transporter permease subunit [Bacteroidota bacterium]
MTISEYTIRHRHTVYALTIAGVVFGVLAYMGLPIQLFPETAPPLVNVLTAYPGAAAADVADLLSDPIEEECASLEGVARVQSTSQDGLSLVSIEFAYDVEVDLAAVDVQNAIARIRARLPREIAEPQVLKFSTSNRPVLTVGVRGEDMADVRRLADDQISAEMQRLPGVALVDVFGGDRPEITVSVDRSRLEAYRVALPQVVEAIAANNASAPAGQITSRGRQYSFRLDERKRDIEDLSRIPVPLPQGGRVLLRDLAEIHSGTAEDQSRFHVNGTAAIAMQVFKQDDANTVEVVEHAQEKIRELHAKYPHLEFIEAEESASFTRQVVDNMLGSVWQALLLAAAIIFLFLGSLRRGIVVALSMPLSFLLAFAGMQLFSIEVNMVTLTAIILAVGMVVDASVVMLENITRHAGLGEGDAMGAAITGANEIQFSVIAGAATTLIVLVPLLFLYGFVGKTFGPLAATLIITFVASLLVALAIVPLFTLLMTGRSGKVEQWAARVTAPWNRMMDHVRDGYLALLTHALRRRWVVVVSAVVLFALGLAMLRGLGMELLPKMDGGASFVTVETPSGSSLAETERVVSEVERLILEENSVLRVSTQMGFEPGMHSFGGGGVQGPTQGYLSITYTPRTERDESIWSIQDRLRTRIARVPNVRNFVVRESGSTAKSTTASSIAIRVSGEDPVILDRLGDDVLATLLPVHGVVNPWRSWRMDQETRALRIDAERAAELGLTPSGVARQLTQALDGAAAGVLRGEGGTDTPIRVRLDADDRDEPADVRAVRGIAGREGSSVPLGAVIEEEERLGQGLITRENLQPTLDVLALHGGRPLSQVTADVRAAVAAMEVPRGYSISLEGEDKDMGESRGELLGALGIALVAVYLLLVAQFRSFRHPLIVLASVPLSLVGVAVALAIAGMPVSMPVMVGLILLVGIVVNNSIILIDFIAQRRGEGHGRREAIIDSVATRFRPIMMTSLSTIVGMIPLALEWALGAERFSPLAVAVIGGMTASTVLTLVVIPVLYDLTDGADENVRKSPK